MTQSSAGWARSQPRAHRRTAQSSPVRQQDQEVVDADVAIDVEVGDTARFVGRGPAVGAPAATAPRGPRWPGRRPRSHTRAADTGFGATVGISGATAIIGAPLDGQGSAYLFDTTTGRQVAKLLPDDAGPLDHFFGISVVISGATAIIGASGHDNGSGAAYLFDTTTGRQVAKLLPDDGAADDWFGFSVAISGATAVVGALFDDDNGSFSGSAYLFDAAGDPGKCPWDLDGDGNVGITDLLLLLADFGSCEGSSADFDGDGCVGIVDLLTLIANFGPCSIECVGHAGCDDDNPCTIDLCIGGKCFHVPIGGPNCGG